MSITLIAGSIAIIIVVAMSIVYMVQGRERARLEKQRLLNSLSDSYRRLQKLLGELPPQYLNKELKMLLVQRSIDMLQDILKEEPQDKSAKARLEVQQEQLNQLQNSYTKPPTEQIVDLEKAKGVQKLLHTLLKFIENQRNKGNLTQDAAAKYSEQIKWLKSKCTADVFILKGKAAIKEQKYRKAIHQYHMAVQEFSHNEESPQAKKAAEKLKLQITELEKRAEEASREQAGIKSLPGDNPAASEWEKLTNEDDDTWKKKQDYDR